MNEFLLLGLFETCLGRPIVMGTSAFSSHKLGGRHMLAGEDSRRVPTLLIAIRRNRVPFKCIESIQTCDY